MSERMMSADVLVSVSATLDDPEAVDGTLAFMVAEDVMDAGGWDVGDFRAIVRCRDCKHMDTVDLSWIYGDHRNDHCFCERLDDGFGVEPDGFCAWGERRGS